MLKLLLADDHAIVRKGVRQILQDEYPTARITEVSNAEELLEKALAEEWDVVITDLSMSGRSGLDALKQLQVSRPSIPVLVLSMYPEEQYALRVLKAGAMAYLTKETAPDELIIAIRKLLQGERYLTAYQSEAMTGQRAETYSELLHHFLSDREMEVMKLIASGRTVSEIAEMLLLSVTTVSTYRSRILQKLQLRNNASVTVYALEHHLIPTVSSSDHTPDPKE
jgi:DNA-binding NarL/FixJ family response regulator